MLSPRRYPSLLALLLILTVLFAAPRLASAQTYTDLHDFNCLTEGCAPYVPALLAQARDGNLYGATSGGGTHNVGTIFKVTPAGVVTTIYNFDNTTGASPYGGLTLGSDGSLYGSTFGGGTASVGTLFKITTAGVLTTLHHFTNTGDGYFPYAPPIQAKDGAYYGVTSSGAAYKVTSAGVYTVLKAAGYISYAPLLQASDGNFYGTSAPSNLVFKMTTTGVQTVVYTFDGTHGSSPYSGLVQGSDNNLYGTTYSGGTSGLGVVFKLTLQGVITVLKNGDTVFGTLYPGLILANDANYYSATRGGGSSNYGTTFKITKTGVATVESNFDGAHGSAAFATPMQHTNGTIFGLTNGGGANTNGVVYSLNVGLTGFARLVVTSGKVAGTVGILGQGFNKATSVTFGGVAATFTHTGDTYISATVPAGAITGPVVVNIPTGNLTSLQTFKVTPTLASFSPSSGPVGTVVTLTGTGLTQTTKVTFNNVVATTIVVNSDSSVSATVPTGATTGKIAITTTGGNVTSTTSFTVM